MACLTPQQVAGYAQQAGFQGSALTQIVDIIFGYGRPEPESSGCPGAINQSQYGTAIGLAQILSINWASLGNQIQGYPFTQGQLTDPLTNLRAAFVLSNGGTDWSPWSASAGPASAGVLPSNGSTTPLSTTGGGAGGAAGAVIGSLWSLLTSPISSVAATLKDPAIRVGLFVLGGIVILGGFFVFGLGSERNAQVITAVKQVPGKLTSEAPEEAAAA